MVSVAVKTRSGADADSATLLWPGLAAAGISAVTAFAALFLRESRTKEQRDDDDKCSHAHSFVIGSARITKA